MKYKKPIMETYDKDLLLEIEVGCESGCTCNCQCVCQCVCKCVGHK